MSYVPSPVPHEPRHLQEYLSRELQRVAETAARQEATATWNPGSIANGASVSTDVDLPGAKLGDVAIASLSVDIGNLAISAQVRAANAVRVTLINNSGGAIDPASGTVRVLLFT